MSTIYTMAAQSVLASAGGTDLMLIHSSTEAKVARIAMASVRAYVMGHSSTQSLAFWGATQTTQPTAAAQADIISTAARSSTGSPWGYATSTQADGIVTLVREIRAVMVAIGLMKGS